MQVPSQDLDQFKRECRQPRIFLSFEHSTSLDTFAAFLHPVTSLLRDLLLRLFQAEELPTYCIPGLILWGSKVTPEESARLCSKAGDTDASTTFPNPASQELTWQRGFGQLDSGGAQKCPFPTLPPRWSGSTRHSQEHPSHEAGWSSCFEWWVGERQSVAGHQPGCCSLESEGEVGELLLLEISSILALTPPPPAASPTLVRLGGCWEQRGWLPNAGSWLVWKGWWVSRGWRKGAGTGSAWTAPALVGG